jgi:hypothetical protein
MDHDPGPMVADKVRIYGKDLHLLLNNCYANHGTTNAREIAAMLAEH